MRRNALFLQVITIGDVIDSTLLHINIIKGTHTERKENVLRGINSITL